MSVKYLINRFNMINILLSQDQIEKFEKYYNMLIEWNQKINLTAITEYIDVVDKHFIDSLIINQFVDFEREQRVLDLGTGAGFPGIPLKIVFSDIEVVLVDSLKKRVDFLNLVIEELKLNNIIALHGRAEDLAMNDKYREKFDFVFSRAVANLSLLSEYCIPFTRVNGQFISYKSGLVDEEVNEAGKAIYVLGGKLETIEKFKLVDTSIERSFVIINKVKKTPRNYPRKAGIPSKSPIK